MSNFTQYITVENVLIVIMAVIIAIGVFNKYKKAKANDGKVDASELIGILLSTNGDVATLLNMAQDSTSVKTNTDKQKFVADHLGDVINKSDFLSDEQKELFHGFGMDNLAKIIVPNKKEEPKQVEAPKEETKPVEVKTETDKASK